VETTLFLERCMDSHIHFILVVIAIKRERGFVRRDPYLTSAVKSLSFTKVCTADLLRHSGLNLCVL